MPSDPSAKGSWWFITSCLKCFPRKKAEQPSETNPDFLAIPYSTHGTPTENHLPQRPLQLPTRVEYDPSGAVSNQFARDRPSSSAAAKTQQPDWPLRSGMERQRFPVNSGKDPREGWSKTVLNAPQLKELFETIQTTLAHVPYVICGLAALVDHGFTERRVRSVSLLCPAYAKDNVRAWLAARGYQTYADSVGISIAGGSITCRVRIKYTDEGFEGLERVRSSVSMAWILGLASQVDHAAAGYVDNWRRLQKLKVEEGTETSEAQGKIEQAMRAIARDIFWCLDKAVRTRHRLDPRLMPTLLGEEFWTQFTERHDNARTEMARAGIDVAAVLARQSAEAAIRDHNAMLKQYGVEEGDGGVTRNQPSPFEGMQTLARKKSVYTLKQGRESTDNDPAGPSVPPSPREDKGKAKENKLLSKLLPKKSSSTAKDNGRSLTRSRSATSKPRDPALVPLPRSSEDSKREYPEWI
ncbi:hypothetical protein F5Y13DRAFT_197007 [Hypoxylon sp. FL1857]|nr:hypothetical protein F5Y13DRAFT_197007 [Hypoxylon sp. FL1857]